MSPSHRSLGDAAFCKNTNDSIMNAIAKRLLSKTPVPAPILGLLDSLRCGGFLLDLCGRVLSLNIMALSCLGDGLVLGNEFLSATDRDTDRKLQYLLSATLSPSGTAPPTPVAVQRHSRLPLVVSTFRLGAPVVGVPSAAVLLLTLDPEQRPEPPREVLVQTFGLTRAEADVAIGVASGKTLVKIAAERAVKIGTVRAHLKTVFAKTNTRSQAYLTGTLARLAFLTPQLGGDDTQAPAAKMRPLVAA